MNLASLPLHHAQEQPAKVALVQGERQLSYQDFWDRIAAAAAGLQRAGVQPGDRVGLCLGDHADHLVLYFAVAAIGATVLPMDHRWTDAEKQQIVAAFDAQLVVREAHEDAIAGAANVVLHDLAATSTRLQPADIYALDDVPFIVALSSGTTGRPKGALVAHRQMHERFVNQWTTLKFKHDDRFASVTPLYFGAARSLCMGFLSLGATVVIDPPPHKPPQLAAAIHASGANIAFLVPTLMHRLLPLAEEGQLMFPELDLLVFGGSIVHGEEALEMQQKLTPNLASYYATSEGGGISVLHADEIEMHGDTVGKPAVQVSVEVVDANDEPLALGETGRLRYRGPGVATVFLTETGECDETSAEGWFCPGDLACIDAEGYISLRGREKEMIIRGGVNVYPAEIETSLREYPGVTEAAVVGWPSKTMGEDVAAFVVGEKSLNDNELLISCKQQLAPYKVPKQIFLLDKMPKTNFGKIDKPDLIKRLPAL